MKNYFDFIMFLAFEVLLEYENKRGISINKLHNYRIEIIKKNLDYYSRFDGFDDEEFEEKLKAFHKLNMDMTEEEEIRNFEKFIVDNSDYFDYKNGIITLKTGVTLDELKNKKFELESYNDRDDILICGAFLSFFDSIECLDILESGDKIKQFVLRLVNDEKIVENAYQIYSEVDMPVEIKKLIASINLRLSLIGNLPEDKMRNYTRVLMHIKDPEKEGEDFWLISEKIIRTDEFYNLNNYIDSILDNKYQRAIFDSGTLAYDRLNQSVDAMWTYLTPNEVMELEPVDAEAMIESMEEKIEQQSEYVDEFDDIEEIVELDNDEFDKIEDYLHDKMVYMLFYLNYIQKINDYQNRFGTNEVLERAKKRLLYVLDAYGDNLYYEKNLNTALTSVSIKDIDLKEDFYDYYVISRLFLVDILEGFIDDDKTLRKMIFVSTYYDLTKDKRIEKIINKYKNTEIGEKIYDTIFSHNYIQFNTTSSQRIKKLTPPRNTGNK